MRYLPVVLLAVSFLAPACYDDVKVVQGTVVAIDTEARTIKVRDERTPNAEVTYRGVKADKVEVGQLVRLAWRAHNDGPVVVRMMKVGAAGEGH